MTTAATRQVDAAIAGGGIAGLWVHAALQRAGYSTVLFEATALGCDQTLASQGMIHGGLKYALGGVLNPASEAIADMPKRWRACLEGDLTQPGDVSLAGVPKLSAQYLMFAESKGLGQLTSFFASRALRGRISKVSKAQWPQALHGLNGVVYALNDFVMDTRSLLHHLAGQAPEHIYQHTLDQTNVSAIDSGYRITCGEVELHARDLIACTGNGSPTLLDELGVNLAVQQRPLKQVMVYPDHHAPLFAHCLTGSASAEPRLTITTDHKDGRSVWYLGGKIATSGVERSDDEQVEFAKAELQRCLGWLNWDNCDYDVLWVNRAEPAQTGGLRPDSAYVERAGRLLLCFPTKLTLTPDLADQVLAQLEPPQHQQPDPLPLPGAVVAPSPWQIN